MKIYLKQKEIEALQKSGELLTRNQIIEKLESKGEKVSDSLILRFLDYRNNPIAPESFAYSVSFKHAFLDRREKAIFWPNSVGLQYRRQ